MSCNGPSSLKLNSEGQWVRAPSLDTNVKLAGEEAKDRLYEPKHKKKLVRVLTVIAYLFLVSLAAIMLSLYYVFLWNGSQRENARFVAPPRQQLPPQRPKCDAAPPEDWGAKTYCCMEDGCNSSHVTRSALIFPFLAVMYVMAH